MKPADFTNEHALFISGDGEARISHDKDTKIANLVKALQRQGKSREEIIKQIQRAKELAAMGRNTDEIQPEPYTGTERRKPTLPYYSLASGNLLAESNGESCPKCQGKLASGKDGNKPVKVCVPCRKIFPTTPVKEAGLGANPKFGNRPSDSYAEMGRDRFGEPKKIVQPYRVKVTFMMDGKPAEKFVTCRAYTNSSALEFVRKELEKRGYDIQKLEHVPLKEAPGDTAPNPAIVKDIQDEKKQRADAEKRDRERMAKNQSDYEHGNVRANWKKTDESSPFPVKDALKVGYPDLKPGDKIRTRKASMTGEVIEVKSENGSEYVYFKSSSPNYRLGTREPYYPTLKTVLSNVTKVQNEA